MARPIKSIKKTRKVTVRFTAAEFLLVERYAKNSGLSIATFIHVKAMNHKVVNRLTEVEMETFTRLLNLSNNMNQIARSTHTLDQDRKRLDAMIDVLEIILRKFK